MADEMDPCECLWNHELAMRRLISLVSTYFFIIESPWINSIIKNYYLNIPRLHFGIVIKYNSLILLFKIVTINTYFKFDSAIKNIEVGRNYFAPT